MELDSAIDNSRLALPRVIAAFVIPATSGERSSGSSSWNSVRPLMASDGGVFRERHQQFKDTSTDAALLNSAFYGVLAKAVVPELILSDRRVYVDSHGAGGRRNSVDPLTRHRNTGCCSERVAHFVHGFHDPPWLC